MSAGRDLGMIGLGTMGRNFALRLGDAGFSVAGMDVDPAKVELLRAAAGGREIVGAHEPRELVAALRRPRLVMLLVPAGPPVDDVIEAVSPLLERGDVVIDGGNSHWRDTDRRGAALDRAGLRLLGVGISGGEEGARRGASLMPGGPRDAYAAAQGMLETVAARYDGEPCVAYLGPGSAGHAVKTVHNAIEYGVMELIAETFDLMERGLGLDLEALASIYERWNAGLTASYLLEITARVLRREDEVTGRPLIAAIRDQAHQKGTGAWAVEDAAALGVATPTIDAAVSQRALSSNGEQRAAVRSVYGPVRGASAGDADEVAARIREAFLAALIITHAQGLSLLRAASDARGYGLDLATVVRIWRGGCIIRSALLGPLAEAYRRGPALSTPMVDEALAAEVRRREAELRSTVATAVRLGIPAPALSASLAYLDALRSDRLPARLIQAQRDLFGAHGYERTDRAGVFHTDWSER